LLIVNPGAQSVTARTRDTVLAVLAERFTVEEVQTKRRGHATELARQATADGADLVVGLGGDGTVNEIVNGLVGSDLPLGIVPGGGADVFARSLGVPKDASAAARAITDWDRTRAQARTVPLGRARSDAFTDGQATRYFVANCGIGFDAAIVRAVESRPRVKRRIGDWYFVEVALRLFFAGGFDRRRPHVELAWGSGPGERKDGMFLAIVQNTDPLTYLGRWPIRICPEARLDGGLDCLAVDTMRARTILPLVASAFRSGRRARGPHTTYLHDRTELRILCDEAMPAQLDGEYIGEHTDLQVESVPAALSVITPPLQDR
jgi:diacylglycerol kinase family enzyme